MGLCLLLLSGMTLYSVFHALSQTQDVIQNQTQHLQNQCKSVLDTHHTLMQVSTPTFSAPWQDYIQSIRDIKPVSELSEFPLSVCFALQNQNALFSALPEPPHYTLNALLSALDAFNWAVLRYNAHADFFNQHRTRQPHQWIMSYFEWPDYPLYQGHLPEQYRLIQSSQEPRS